MDWLSTLFEYVGKLIPVAKVGVWERAVRFTYVPTRWILFDLNTRRFCRHRIEAHVDETELNPGLHRRIPYFEEVHEHSVVEKLLPLQGQSITTLDDRSVTLKVNIVYEIKNVKKAITEVDDFENSLRGLTEIFIAKNTRNKTWTDLRLGLDDLETELKKTLTAESKDWGAKIKLVGITTLVQTRAYRIFGDEHLHAEQVA